MTPVWVFLAVLGAWGATPSPTPSASVPPPLKSLLKLEVWRRVTVDREIMTSASLDRLLVGPLSPGASGEAPRPASDGPPLKRYSAYAAMLVRPGLAKAKRILTDYRLYVRMVPYVDRADYNEATGILRVEGGIWSFRLGSSVRFTEVGDRWIRFRIVGGHFTGMEGDIFFESLGEKGTVILFRAEQIGRSWPPAFVIERGAEIVFGFTAKKMRSYMESPESDEAQEGPKPHDKKRRDGKEDPRSDDVPRPRRRLSSF